MNQENQEAMMAVERELQLAGTDPKLRKRWNTLEDRRITPEKEIPPMEFLFELFNKPCFPRGELVAMTGKAKSGKTFMSTILMEKCLSGEGSSGRRDCHCSKPPSRDSSLTWSSWTASVTSPTISTMVSRPGGSRTLFIDIRALSGVHGPTAVQ